MWDINFRFIDKKLYLQNTALQNLLLKYMSFSLQSSPETETVSLKG